VIESSKKISGIPDHPLFTLEFQEPDHGLEGFVCIHSLGRTGSIGGLRWAEDISRQEIEEIARTMAYKYAFFGIPTGGARAGIKISSVAGDREEIIRAVARRLEPLVRKGIWSPWTDMNFSSSDLVTFYAALGMKCIPNAREISAYRTAVSVISAIRGWVRHRNARPEDIRILMEGFGTVADYLCSFLEEEGFQMVGISNSRGAVANPSGLDMKRIMAEKKEKGSRWILSEGPWERIFRDDLLSMDADLLIPGARAHSISEENAGSLQVEAIIPIANAPCTSGSLEKLWNRGILYIPDYVANGGGVCGHLFPVAADGTSRIFSNKFTSMIERLLARSNSSGISPSILCNQVAEENFLFLTGSSNQVSGKWKKIQDVAPFLKEAKRRRERMERVQITWDILDNAGDKKISLQN